MHVAFLDVLRVREVYYDYAVLDILMCIITGAGWLVIGSTQALAEMCLVKPKPDPKLNKS